MQTFIGIDVGKKFLDISICDKHFQINNDKEGYCEIIQYTKKYVSKDNDILFVCEASGGYEKPLIAFLTKKKFDTHVAHPNKIKSFARAKGYLAKTDKIDAKLIAEYASTMGVSKDKFPLSNEELAIKQLIVRREQLRDQRKVEKTRLDTCDSSFITNSIQKTIKFLDREIQAVENQLEKKQKSSGAVNAKVELFSSIPGVGVLTGQYLVSFLPELGQVSNKKLASLVGVAPFCKDSGKHSGKRFIQGGRKRLRNQLYMIAVGCVKNNPMLSKFYHRLREKGKLAKVAFVAVIRKLLSIFNSIMQRNSGWEERVNLA